MNLDSLIEQVAKVVESAPAAPAAGYSSFPYSSTLYGSQPAAKPASFTAPSAKKVVAPWASLRTAPAPVPPAPAPAPLSAHSSAGHRGAPPAAWHKAGAPSGPVAVAGAPSASLSPGADKEKEEQQGKAKGTAAVAAVEVKGTTAVAAGRAELLRSPGDIDAIPSLTSTGLAELLSRASGFPASASGAEAESAKAAMDLLTRQLLQAASAKADAPATPLPPEARAAAGPSSCSFRYELRPEGDVDAWFRNIRRRIEVELDDGCAVELCLQMAR